MFFLKLDGADLKRVLQVAAEKKIEAERAARLAFLKGLRFLAKDGAEIKQKPIKQEVQEYIRQHWAQETDTQIGEALGYGSGSIRNFRLNMGLLRKRGPRFPHKKSTEPSGVGALSPRQQRREQLEALIREHWQTKSDADIGRLMDPVASRMIVRARRLALGLKNPRGKRTGIIREMIEPTEFERMVIHEGYTMAEYIRFKNIHCSRERLRQVAEDLGLKHSPEDRAPEWLLVRKARGLGNLNLADREWLAERLSKAPSVASLAAELEVSEHSLYFFIRHFKLTHPSIRKYGTMTVELVCAKCDTKFTRLKRHVDREVKRVNGKEPEFFCSASCGGQFNHERSERRKAAAQQTQ